MSAASAPSWRRRRRGADDRRAEAPDTGLLAAFKECIGEQGLEVEAKSHADSIHAGAIGAAIWGAFRYDKLAELGQLPKAS